MKRHVRILVGALLLLGIPSAASAQEEEIAPEDIRAEVLEKADEDKKEDGWHYEANIAVTGSFTHSSNVVGAVDGITVQLGAVLSGAVEFISGQHEWRTTLNVTHTQSLTPQIDSFVKSADRLELESIYMYRFDDVPWLGAFGRFRFNTQLFPGYVIRTDPVRVIATDSDGGTQVLDFPAQEQIPLTGAFEPLIFFASGGIFANPIEKKAFTLKSKAGFGAQQIVAHGGYTLDDNDDTPEIEIIQLENSTQLGAELELALNGIINKGVTWNVKANFFFPVLTLADTDLEGIELLNTDISAGLSVKLGKWASLDYIFSARRTPLVLDAWQVQNGLLLTAGFDLL